MKRLREVYADVSDVNLRMDDRFGRPDFVCSPSDEVTEKVTWTAILTACEGVSE